MTMWFGTAGAALAVQLGMFMFGAAEPGVHEPSMQSSTAWMTRSSELGPA